MKSLIEINEVLKTPQRIVITHHYNPDADALGSTLGLYHYLTQRGHSCQIISPNTIPDFIMWMPSSDTVMIYEDQPAIAEKVIQEADILFSLDYNQYSRTHSMTDALVAFTGITAMIDHHLFPDTNFQYGSSIPQKSSTCEMVYDFINECGDNKMITVDMAMCLYAGAMTDTGSFKFPCTTAGVHLMVADLISKGLETSPIHQAIFDTYEESRLRFLGYVLSEKMVLNHSLHTSLIPISKDDMNRFQLKTGDTEGIVNFPLSIKDIIFSTFISERDNEIRMSFRSKGRFNVNEFARTYFNGGGHANAAGGRSLESLSTTIEHLNQAILKTETQLKQCYNELL